MKLIDNWIGIEGMDNGHPFLVRARENMQIFINSGLYRNRMDICWTFAAGDKSLMPDTKDLNLMTKVENCLVNSLESDLLSVLAFAFTGNNRRVWYWYTKNVEETMNRINKELAKFNNLPIEIFENLDSEWQEYQSVID